MLEWLEGLILVSVFGVSILFMIIMVFTFLWATWTIISLIVDVVEILVDCWIENPTIIKTIRIITRILCILSIPILGGIASRYMVTY